MNAFEDENDNVYVDIICYPDDTIAQQLMVEGLRNPTQMKPPRLAASELRRYVLHTVSVTGSRHPSTVSGNSGGGLFGAFRKTTPATNSIPEASYNKWLQPSLELPQVNPNYKLHAHTFMYGLGFSASSSIADGQIWDTIIKAVSWILIHVAHCVLITLSRICVIEPLQVHGMKKDVIQAKQCLFHDHLLDQVMKWLKMMVFF